MLLNKLFKKTVAPSPWLPANIRVYCIGDIHGRIDLLTVLVEKIKQDAADFSGHVVMVYLGDFIDRGLYSRDVIEFILGDVQAGIEYVYLRGNHEQTLLDFLQEDSVGRSWLSFGGQTTLSSYGVQLAKIPTKREDFVDIQRQLRNNLPDTHYRFLLGTRCSYTLGAYFFVHAGVNPRYSLAKQYPEDMLWIRDEFTANKKPFEKIIVHGHTVTEEPAFFPNRIGIDTGAYASGVLTCLVLESDQQRLIQAMV